MHLKIRSQKIKNGFQFLGHHISSGIAFNSSIPDLYIKMRHQSFGCVVYLYHKVKTKTSHMRSLTKEGPDKIQSPWMILHAITPPVNTGGVLLCQQFKSICTSTYTYNMFFYYSDQNANCMGKQPHLRQLNKRVTQSSDRSLLKLALLHSFHSKPCKQVTLHCCSF